SRNVKVDLVNSHHVGRETRPQNRIRLTAYRYFDRVCRRREWIRRRLLSGRHVRINRPEPGGVKNDRLIALGRVVRCDKREITSMNNGSHLKSSAGIDGE